MSDPIDDLARFGAGFSTGTGGDMPHSAADVRRRGDQIRRRRTALVAGASALAVAAVAVPVFALVSGDPKADNRDNVANDPTTSLSAANLLSDAETEFSPGEKSAFTTTDTNQDDSPDAFHCQQDTLSSLAATATYHRSYDFAPVELEPGDVAPVDAPGDGLTETIAEFKNTDAARAAYEDLTEWILDCAGNIPGADRVNVVPQGRSVVVPGGGDAVIYDVNWGPAPVEVDPNGDFAFINETGLVLLGNRIAVLAVTVIGQDYNFLEEDGGTPVNRMIPTAAERLRPDGSSPSTPVEPSETTTGSTGDPSPGSPPSSSTVNPAIADDFPLLVGWPEDSQAEDNSGRVGPRRDLDPPALTACDVKLDDAPHADRLLSRWENVEDFRSRQLTTYSNVDQAIAAADGIRALYAGCPEGETRQDGYTPLWKVQDATVGGQSFVVFGWDEFNGAPTTFGETLLVVRVGISVLVVAHSGHSGNPQGREQETIDQITAESATVISEMCTFTEAGC